MSTLLVLYASVRNSGSVTRSLTADFLEDWAKQNPDAKIQTRDLGAEPVDGPDADWTTANAKLESDRTETDLAKLATSEDLVQELREADRIVLASPMYNFGTPWTLKTYIDNIVRKDRTFSFSPDAGFSPLLDTQKKMLMISASAGTYEKDSPFSAFNFLLPYVQTVFSFMGITDFTSVSAPNQWADEETQNTSMENARSKLAILAHSW